MLLYRDGVINRTVSFFINRVPRHVITITGNVSIWSILLSKNQICYYNIPVIHLICRLALRVTTCMYVCACVFIRFVSQSHSLNFSHPPTFHSLPPISSLPLSLFFLSCLHNLGVQLRYCRSNFFSQFPSLNFSHLLSVRFSLYSFSLSDYIPPLSISLFQFKIVAFTKNTG